MTYQQAKEKALTVEWKVGFCPQGAQCWCRTIEPLESITFTDGEVSENYSVVRAGEISKGLAEYFVKLHNEHLKRK